MKTSTLVCSITLSLLAAGSFAQTAAPAAPAAATTTPAPLVKEMAEAEVRKVDKDAKKSPSNTAPSKTSICPA